DLLINDLISWIERRGIGTLEAFLHSAILARPESLALRQFCKEHFPKSLDELQAAELVQGFDTGLRLLIDMANNPTVRQISGAFRADMSFTSRQIQLLNQYKSLHDILHELQMKFDAIATALKGKNKIGLIRHAHALRRLAIAARRQTVNLPTKSDEVDWI